MVFRKVLDGSGAPAVCVRVVRNRMVKESESIKYNPDLSPYFPFLGILEVKF